MLIKTTNFNYCTSLKKSNLKESNYQTHWKAYVEGDNLQLSTIYKAFYSTLLFTAYNYTQQNELAQDVVADVFEKLLKMSLKERKEYLSNVSDKLAPFLKTLVKNKALDKIKVNKNRSRIRSNTKHLFTRYINEELLFSEDVQQLIEVLPKQQQLVLNLHLQGFKNQEISEKLGIKYNTVRNTLVTAKNKMRRLWYSFM